MDDAPVIRKYRVEDRKQCRDLWRALTEWHRTIYEDPTIGGQHPEVHARARINIVSSLSGRE